MAARRATEGGALRTLRSTNPSTARPRAVDGTCGFRTLPITGKSLGRVEQSHHITDARRLLQMKIHCGAKILKPGPACDQSAPRSPLSTPLRQQAWEHASESPPAKPATDLQCERKP